MSDGYFLEPLKLGPPGAEIELTAANWAHPTGVFTELPNRIATEIQTIVGVGRSAVHAQYDPQFSLNIDGGSHKTRDAIRALHAMFHTQLAFLYADAWLIPSEYYKLTEDADHFYMRENPYQRLDELYDDLSLAEVLVQSSMKVYATFDAWGAVRGTNYFSSYNRQTRKVTLTGPLPAGTELFFDYRYKGCTVRFQRAPQLTSGRGFILGTRQWIIRIGLEAV